MQTSELLAAIDKVMLEVSEGMSKELDRFIASGSRLDYKDSFHRKKSFVTDMFNCIQFSPLQYFLSKGAIRSEKSLLTMGSFIYAVLLRDLKGFNRSFWVEDNFKTTNPKRYYSIMAEVLRLIDSEMSESECRHEKNFLSSFKFPIKKGGQDYFNGSGYLKIQVEFPMPEKVNVINLDRATSNETIPIDDFISMVHSAQATKPTYEVAYDDQISLPMFYELEEIRKEGRKNFVRYLEFESNYFEVIKRHLSSIEKLLDSHDLDSFQIDLLSKAACTRHAFHLWNVSRLAGAQTFIQNKGANLDGPMGTSALRCAWFYQWNYLLTLDVNMSEELFGDLFFHDISAEMSGMGSSSKYQAYDAVYDYISWHYKRPNNSVKYSGPLVTFEDLSEDDNLLLEDVASIIRKCDRELLNLLKMNEEFLNINVASDNLDKWSADDFLMGVGNQQNGSKDTTKLLPFFTLTTYLKDNLIDLYFDKKNYDFDYNWFIHWARKRDFDNFSALVWYKKDIGNMSVKEKIRIQVEEAAEFVKGEIINSTDPFEKEFLNSFIIFSETRGAKSGFD
ncbi:MAG TPA: hypothetical protein VNJ01_15600 [Bacteriovoracaceae bacterium]|nr:hypothetical protein [Bacteriovoracaceae bacterium]